MRREFCVPVVTLHDVLCKVERFQRRSLFAESHVRALAVRLRVAIMVCLSALKRSYCEQGTADGEKERERGTRERGGMREFKRLIPLLR